MMHSAAFPIIAAFSSRPVESPNNQTQQQQQQQQQQQKGSFIDNHPCLIPAGVALGVDIGALFFEPLAPWAVSYSAHAFACEFIF
jgi:hypothetical protein